MNFRGRCVSLLALGLPLLAVGCDELRTGSGARLVIDPPEVIFRATTPRAEPYVANVKMTNVGGSPLVLSAVTIAGDQQFVLGNAGSLQGMQLGPGGSIDAQIQYFSINLDVRTAQLQIQSSDQNRPSAVVPIRNEDIKPRIVVTDCVRLEAGATDCFGDISDQFVEFGDVRQGECRTAEITVENFGQANLDVQGAEFQAGSSPDISFDPSGPGTFSLTPINNDGTTDKQVIQVKYCPNTSTEATATLIIASNDPGGPVAITLHGTSLTNEAPTCVCNPDTMEVAPLDTITLSGAGCNDPDGQPLQFQWNVLQRPTGSTATLRNANSRDSTFFVDLATTPQQPYVFEVTATDTWGASASCQITVFATPRDALHIQLVWDKDSTDVDLHVLNPIGAANRTGPSGWFDLTNDCHYLNRNPDWGVVGNTQDNGRLDIDDVNGFGPENINVSRPQSGTFAVGVHYFCDDDLGASTGTVRIYCNGIQAAEFTKSLPSSGFFWDVATVVWPGCTISELNQTRTVSQGCQGFTFP